MGALYRFLGHGGCLLFTLYVLMASVDLLIRFELKQSAEFDSKREQVRDAEAPPLP